MKPRHGIEEVHARTRAITARNVDALVLHYTDDVKRSRGDLTGQASWNVDRLTDGRGWRAVAQLFREGTGNHEVLCTRRIRARDHYVVRALRIKDAACEQCNIEGLEEVDANHVQQRRSLYDRRGC